MYHLKAIKNNHQLLAKEYDFTVDKTIPNVSDNYVNFKNDPNISNSQATFTCQPTLQYCEAKILCKLRLKVRALRQIINGVYDAADPTKNTIQTPAYVLSCDNFTVPIGCVNNLITKLTVNTGNESYTHENNNSVQRQLETQINFMQYDQKRLNEKWGIHLNKDIEPFLDYGVAIGDGVLKDVKTIQSVMKSNANMYGYKSMLYDKYSWILDRNTKYSILDRDAQRNVASYLSTNPVTISNTGVNGYGEFTNMPQLNELYVTQIAYIDIYEYIMAPFLSTGYKDNLQMDKIFTTENNVMSISMNFDTAYLKNIIKCSSEITINSVDIESIELKDMHLFSSQEYKQSIENRFNLKNQSLVYTHDVSYTPDVKMGNVAITGVTPTKTTVSFTKSAQNVLSRYYLLACPLNMTQNNTAQLGCNIKDIVLQQISNLKLEITGSKTQYVLQNYTHDELVKMTSDVLQNDNYWLKFLDKKYGVTEPFINRLQEGDYDLITTNINFYNGNADNKYALDGTGFTANRHQHLSFYILDMEKLSLGLSSGGAPISPGVLYNDRFSIKFTYDVDNSIDINDYPQMMRNVNIVQKYVANPMCIPITLNIGRVNSSKQFELIPDQMNSNEFTNKFDEMLEGESYRITSAHLQFGGGFFGDLWNDIKSVASTVAPIAESVIPIVDKIAGKVPRRLYKRAL